MAIKMTVDEKSKKEDILLTLNPTEPHNLSDHVMLSSNMNHVT